MNILGFKCIEILIYFEINSLHEMENTLGIILYYFSLGIIQGNFASKFRPNNQR